MLVKYLSLSKLLWSVLPRNVGGTSDLNKEWDILPRSVGGTSDLTIFKGGSLKPVYLVECIGLSKKR